VVYLVRKLKDPNDYKNFKFKFDPHEINNVIWMKLSELKDLPLMNKKFGSDKIHSRIYPRRKELALEALDLIKKAKETDFEIITEYKKREKETEIKSPCSKKKKNQRIKGVQWHCA